MTDVLIRNVPEDDLRRIDEKAARASLSRSDYLRGQIAKDAATGLPGEPPTLADFDRLSDLASDLDDAEVMRGAWR